jgi:hypothetical protein
VNCPKCGQKAEFVRIRNMPSGPLPVWTCNFKKCTYYMLYFYERAAQPEVRK